MDLWLAIPPPATQLPSFFELSLLRLLKDALISASGNHLDTAIRKVGLAGWEEEARAVARGAVEWRSVSKGDGLVGEGSYGLKRSRVVGDGQGRRMEDMRTGDQIRAVAMAVAVGWGDGRGREMYERFKRETEEHADTREDTGRYARFRNLKKLFVRVYPYIRLSLSSVSILSSFLYLHGLTVYHSPTDWMIGQVVRRKTMQDIEVGGKGGGRINQRRGGGGEGGRSRAKKIAMAALFAFTVYGWVKNAAEEIRKARREGRSGEGEEGQMEAPESLIPKLPASTKRIVTETPHLCPLCRRKRVNPTVVKETGFVYCYRCIVGAVRTEGRDPVTGAECSEDGIIRLFVEEGGGE
ncbi:hypothetical protein TrCOL_g3222 [Triparma columacea]|uniref:Peroxin-12 n=1 Tax=Triparma columacea TaxID=722753 RepID=A0A9W7G0E3_9STRA|nr:hypothetical protein TrCOL_g3222 [Triparma columacea]